ncbi:peptidoglycan-recognition protein 2-like [Neocloeon triangulifer]|uniref:peptidoglycan-recognition protein 2-like n=1 Tax=Neocloeon triangulifer TaxID=2078957 RepID=UPI00286F121A|nr:peptidoglycan-recognition protein 2-like [Neocloeon triangulifer]
MKTAVVLLACLASAFAACPNIVSRSAWGARPPTSITYLSNPVPYVVIHHSESGTCSSQASCSALVRGFQDQHMDVNGWSDIGYSFLVGGDGNIYEGRGWDRVGAHAPGYNSNSIGICFIGSYISSAPSSTLVDPVRQLIQCGMDDRYVQLAHMTIGHRQAVATDCPGDALYSLIQTWPDFEPNP